MTPKRSKEKIIRDNAAKGKSGERRVRDRYEKAGYNVERTGHGHDFRVTRINPITGEKETKYLEVKTGDADLSPQQELEKRRLDEKYLIVNGDPTFRSNLVPKYTKPARHKLPGSFKVLPKPAWLGPSGSPPKGRSTKSAGYNIPSIRLGGPKPAWLGPSGSPPKGRSKKSSRFDLFSSPSKGRRSRAPKWTI